MLTFILGAIIGSIITTIILGVCRSAGERTPMEQQREDEEQIEALNAWSAQE